MNNPSCTKLRETLTLYHHIALDSVCGVRRVVSSISPISLCQYHVYTYNKNVNYLSHDDVMYIKFNN